MKAKFKKGQSFYSEKQDSFFTIRDVKETDKGYLYSVEYPLGRKDGNTYSRYYQDRLESEFTTLEDTKKAKRAIKVIYGSN